MHAINMLTIVMTCIASAATCARGDVISFSLTELGQLPSDVGPSVATGINESGQVVGYGITTDGLRAFIWEEGVITDLGDIPGESRDYRASGINDAGQVVGYSNTPTRTRGFMWEDGVMTDLAPLEPIPGLSLATSINNTGQIAGYSTPDGGIFRGTLWTDGNPTDLGALSGLAFSPGLANDINDDGKIVGRSESNTGQRAYVWENGMMSELDDMPAGISLSEATAINEVNQIIGYSRTGALDRGFLWEDNTLTDLGVLYPNHNFSRPLDINNTTQIVGFSRGTDGDSAFLWEQDEMKDLSSLLDHTGDGWTLSTAVGINSLGQIIGFGTNSHGQSRSYLLTPSQSSAVPEPSTAVGIFVIALILGASRVQHIKSAKKSCRREASD